MARSTYSVADVVAQLTAGTREEMGWLSTNGRFYIGRLQAVAPSPRGLRLTIATAAGDRIVHWSLPRDTSRRIIEQWQAVDSTR